MLHISKKKIKRFQWESKLFRYKFIKCMHLGEKTSSPLASSLSMLK